MFSRAPRMPVEINAVESERFVLVQRAPEPSDVWWENTCPAGHSIPIRRALSWVLYIVMLAVSLAVQFAIAQGAESERNRRIGAQFKVRCLRERRMLHVQGQYIALQLCMVQ
jgi:hypothetical protein